MFSRSFGDKFSPILDKMLLSSAQKGVIHARYVDIVTNLEWSQFWVDFLYYLLTNAITISAVLIVAFSSFDRVAGSASTTAQAFLWVVWSLGVVTALSNKWLYGYDIPKKHVLYAVIIEKLQSEGWSFVSGIDRYDGLDIDARFQLFCSRVEQIQMKSAKSRSSGGGGDAETVNDVIAMGQAAPSDDILTMSHVQDSSFVIQKNMDNILSDVNDLPMTHVEVIQ